MPFPYSVTDTMSKTKRNDVPVKIDAEVVRIARIVAAYDEQTLAEYLSERLRPLVAADLAKRQKAAPRLEPAGD